MTGFTRRYRFSASHRLHTPALTDIENQRLYGKCNNPYGHGHDYILEVTAAGPIDAATGLILERALLDRLVEDQILSVFSNRNLNLDRAEFCSLVPTTENVALVIAQILNRNWTTYLGRTPARLRRIHLQETDRNSFEVLLPITHDRSASELETERVHVHA